MQKFLYHGDFMKNMMIVLVSFLTLQSAHASLNSDIKNLPADDLKIFRSTLSMCEATTNRAYVEQSNLWIASFFDSGSLVSITRLHSPLEMSSELQSMIGSMGFHLALTKCYGDNQLDKNLFFSSLLLLDISGKLAVWSSDIRLLVPLAKAAFWGLWGIRSTGFLPKAIWTHFRAIEKTAANKTTLGFITSHRILYTVTPIYIADKLYLAWTEGKEVNKSPTGEPSPKVQKIKSEIANYQVLLNESTDPKEIQLLQKFIKQDSDQLKLAMKIE